MATREYVRCLVCGSQRTLDAFSIGERGDYDPRTAIAYEAAFSIKTMGGRGNCRWDKDDLPLHLALALRARLQDVLEDLEQELRAGGVDFE